MFLSPDSIIPDPGDYFSYNRYLYARGNPISNNDPTGHQVPCCITGPNALLQVMAEQLGKAYEKYVAPKVDQAKDAVTTMASITTFGLSDVTLSDLEQADQQAMAQYVDPHLPVQVLQGRDNLSEFLNDPLMQQAMLAAVDAPPAAGFGELGQAELRLAAREYPQITDLKTGAPIPFPSSNNLLPIYGPEVPWNTKLRGEFIKEWYDRGYSDPPLPWSEYDIHHILPREYGGTNDFDNLTPVLRTEHPQFNTFWQRWGANQNR